MPRYFFHLADGTILPDSNGLELDDADEAWRTALGFMADLLRMQRDDLRLGDGWSVEVAQEDESSRWRLSFRSEAIVAE